MIYISQGHERGIGLEVFFKSTLSLPQFVLDHFMLFATKESCNSTLISLNLDFSIGEDYISIAKKKIKLSKVKANKFNTESSQSLLDILEVIDKKDILITLPTSKDQLPLNNQLCAGYTEFFRSYYNGPSISMLFQSYDLRVLLLTDHIPLSSVPLSLSSEFASNKVFKTLEAIELHYGSLPNEVVFSGINPHAGEGGLLGNEDLQITIASKKISQKFPKINVIGPVPGDTLHFHHKVDINQLFIYAFHDQALAYFKDRYGLFGINITMGLDFLRMSVDHGTAFSLYQKNIASTSGCLYVLNEAFKVHSR